MILQALSEITELLPDIPRWYTGLAEWAAVMVYVSLLRPRFKDWRRPALIVSSLPLMIGLQVLVGTWPPSLWILGMSSAILYIVLFIFLAIDTSVRDAIYLGARAFVLAELVASLEWQLWVHWHPATPSPQMDNDLFAASIVLFAFSYGVGFGLARMAEKRNFSDARRLNVDNRSLITTIAIALGTFLVSNLSFLTTSTPFSGQLNIDVFYIRTLVDLTGFVALYTQQSNRNQMRGAIALAETRLVMRAQHEQYLQSKRNIEELNRMHHDLKHWVAEIRDEESADVRSDYLDNLEGIVRGYESDIQTGNPLLDVVVSAKMERCLQDGINMTAVVDGAALGFVDSISLSALFGNGLDNAIEAVSKVPDPEQRIIKLSVFTQGKFVLVRFENYCPWPVKFVDGLPQTSKRDRTKHGHGMRNMKDIVESYGGSLTVNIVDDWFTVRALIPK